MTISSNDDPKAGPYNGNDSQAAFPFAFRSFLASDLLVVRTDEDGVEHDLVPGSDYSVSLNADQNANPGGTVTYPISGDPLPTGETLTIVSDLEYLQPLNLLNGGAFSPSAQNSAFDRVTMLVKQVKEKVSRALQLAVSTPAGVDVTLPVPEASKVIGWSADGTSLANFAADTSVSTDLFADRLASPSSASNGNLLLPQQGKVNVRWYPGADDTGATDSTAAFTTARATGHANYVPAGSWKLNAAYSSKIRIEGDGSYASLLRANNTASAMVTYDAASPFWTYHSEVNGIGLYGTAKTGVGFTFGKTDPSAYAVGDEYKNNVRFVGFYTDGLDKGIQFPFGNIGSSFYDCGASSSRYGYYLLDNKFGGDLMHAGNKYWYAGESNTNDCAVYINNTTDGFGGVSFRDHIFEQNQVAVYCNTSSVYTPVVFDNVWLEANGFLQNGTANVTLDTWTGTTKSTASFVNHALIFDGTKGVYNYNGGFFTDCHVKGTNIQVTSRGSRVEQESGVNGRPCVVDNADSAIYIVDPSTDQSLPTGRRVIVKGIVNQMAHYEIDGVAGNASAKAWFGPHRTALRPMRASVGVSRRMQTVETSLAGSTYSVTGTVVEDGVLFPTCNEWSIPFTSTSDFVAINGTNLAMTAGWWVATLMVKVVSVGGSGVMPNLSITRSDGSIIFANLVPVPSLSEWHTLVVMGKATGTLAACQFRISGGGNGTAVVRMQAAQWVRFDTKHEAQLYVESGAFSDAVRGGGVVRVTGATYTVLEGDEFITANRAGTTTLTLPAAVDYPGRNIHVRTIQAQTVVSATANVEPLAGGALATGILAAAAGRWARLVSDGAQWMIHEAG